MSNDIGKNLEYRDKQSAVESAVSSGGEEPLGSLAERAGTGQEDLVELLESADEYLNANHAELTDELPRGATNAQIEKLNQALAPLQISEDFATLLKWHNGLPSRAVSWDFRNHCR